jgi:hypothetical protein
MYSSTFIMIGSNVRMRKAGHIVHMRELRTFDHLDDLDPDERLIFK